ncbi:MAG: ATP-binding protein [Burkholderiales bacterium]
MYIWWGPELLCFYNDAYRRSIGPERHPSSLGQPARQVWDEIWHLIGPQIEQVVTGQGATWHENALVPITRGGKLEDVYWTYSYSPLDDISAPHGVGGVLVVCAETTATVLAERQKAEEVVRQREMFAQAPGFMIVMSGPDHRVEFVNDAHRRLFGSDDWVGKSIRDAFPDIAGQGFYELLDEVFATKTAYRSGRVPARFRHPDNGVEETRILDFIYAPVYDAQHQVIGVFCEGFDVTIEVQSEHKLRDREEQLRLATEAADVALWDLDPASDKLYWPARLKAMFGISAIAEVSMADFYAGLHPDDREATSLAFAAAIDPSRRSLYDVEFRAVGKGDGVIRWVAAKGRGVFDEQGRCTRVLGTAINITSRHATDESLRVSEERLREADRRKDVFLATLAHELRNPLAPIGNAATLLQHPRLDAAQAARYGQMIERQTKAMAVLLDDLLEVSRISTGKLQLKKKTVSVASLVDAAVEPVRETLESRGYRLQVTMQSGELLLEADPVRLAQVLTNLLANAIKYSDRGSTIALRSDVAPDHVRFEIEDGGIGLSHEQIPQIFKMFAQVSPSLDRAEGGLGIGLAVARVLVEMHGGQIMASSMGLGKGSTFTVIVPRGQAETNAARAEPTKGAAAAHATGRPILVVDDNVDAAETLATLLQLEGYDVHTTHDAKRALQIAREMQPAACFLDIGLPGMDGYEVARQLRAAEAGSELFLVATTGWGQPEDKSRAMAAGFDLHLTKPIDLVEASKLLAARFRV